MNVADLVSRTAQEVAALPTIDAAVAQHIENGLSKWGLSLRASATRLGAVERTPEERSVQHDGAKTAKDELLQAVGYLLAGRESRRFLCFRAYHGIHGRAKRTLRDIGDRGTEHGFDAPVTRERVRQVVAQAEGALRRRGSRIGAAHWRRWRQAVVDTREVVPATVDGVVAAFGYRSCDEPADVFAMLRLVADVLSFGVSVRRTIDSRHRRRHGRWGDQCRGDGRRVSVEDNPLFLRNSGDRESRWLRRGSSGESSRWTVRVGFPRRDASVLLDVAFVATAQFRRYRQRYPDRAVQGVFGGSGGHRRRSCTGDLAPPRGAEDGAPGGGRGYRRPVRGCSTPRRGG